MRQAFPAHFFALTKGVAIADTTLAERPDPVFAPVPDLPQAVAWLEGRQSIDGHWEDSPGTALDTAAVLRTLRAVGHSSQLGYQQGITWLLGQQPSNLDYRARRAVALAETTTPLLGADDLAAGVQASQNTDGGFGVASGYRSDAFDTALALRALHALGRPADAQVRSALAQLPDLAVTPGLWPMVSGADASTIATAQVLLALLDWVETAEAQDQIAAAAAGLRSRHNLDGGFGESPSTPYATALALQGLVRSAAAPEVIDAAVAWLESHQSLDGSWNGSPFETAQVVDALVVPPDDLVLDPAPVPEGDLVRVTAVVLNEGATATPPSVARLFDADPATAPGLADAFVPALQPGEQASVAFDYATSGKAGTQTLYVVADADEEVAESREFDNATSRSLRVDGPFPDLVLTPFDIVATPAPAEAGESVEIAVTVRNLGEAPAPGSLLRVLDGRPLAGGTLIDAAVVPPLGLGEAISVSVFWDTSGAEGSHAIVAIADADFAIDEGEAERNNEAEIDLEVTGPLPPGPDFAFGLLTVEPSVMSFVPQPTSIRVVARNLGVDAAVTEASVFDGDIGAPPLATLSVSLEGRSSTILDLAFELPTPGSRSLIIVADPADLVVETDEANNQASISVTDPQNTFDVAMFPGEVAVSSDSVIVGEPIDVTATVRNRGTAAVFDLPVVLERRDAGGLSELTRTLVSLPPGASTVVVLSWTTSFTGTPAELRVEADPFDLVAELDETNNAVDIDVDIAASPLTNLAVSGADVAFSPDPPLEGGAATVSALVVNGSAVDAPGFVADLFLGDPDAGGVPLGQATASGLSAGDAVALSIDWNPVDARGAQGVFVVVDPQDLIAEYDETDNRGFRPFDVLGLPDLVLTTAAVVLDPAFPRASEPVDVRATLRNLGAQTASATVLRAWEGEPQSGVLIGDVAVPGLAPGASASVELSWTPAAPPGVRTLSLVVDADDAVVEQDEGSNLSRQSVVVQDADLFLTHPHFSPNGDGAQDETTLAYRANVPVDVVVTDARGAGIRTLAEDAPEAGQIDWDGRDESGRLVADGDYAFVLQGEGGRALGRVIAHVDTNRSTLHDAAGTGLVAVRNLTCSLPPEPFNFQLRGPAWLPSEAEALFIIGHSFVPDFPLGLIRVTLDGDVEYVAQDDWYSGAGFTDFSPVSPDGLEVIVRRFNETFVVDLATGTRRALTMSFNSTRWSPDGLSIVAGDQILDRSGSVLATLPSGDWRWLPDGGNLVNPSSREEDGDRRAVDVVRRDGTGFSQIVLDSGADEVCDAGVRSDGSVYVNAGERVEDQGGESEFCRVEVSWLVQPDSGGHPLGLVAGCADPVPAFFGRVHSADQLVAGARPAPVPGHERQHHRRVARWGGCAAARWANRHHVVSRGHRALPGPGLRRQVRERPLRPAVAAEPDGDVRGAPPARQRWHRAARLRR